MKSEFLKSIQIKKEPENPKNRLKQEIKRKPPENPKDKLNEER